MASEIELSLSVGKGLAPFVLTGSESEMGPEDWAWRFLRLNSDYRKAYIEAAEKQAANPELRTGVSRFREVHEHRTVLVGEQSCRDRFGLSTWRDPSQSSLPMLGEGQSWFAPLRAVDVAYPRDFSECDFNAPDGLFGLLRQRAKPMLTVEVRVKGRPSKAQTRSAEVDFSIDCSVPLQGQIASVAFLASQYALRLREMGLTSSDFKPKTTEVLIRDDVIRKDGMGQGNALLLDRNSNELVRSISIYLAKRPGPQIKKYQRLLLKEQQWLISKEITQEPVNGRFWERLAITRGRAEGSPSYGHRLKAYVILAECFLAGVDDPREIIAILKSKGAGSQVATKKWESDNDWIELEDEGRRTRDFGRFLNDAKKYVSDGYKWLVHSQKPLGF